MCLRKYSWPLPDEPSRFARHTVITRGWFWSASGSSHANRSRPSRSSETTNSAGSTPARSASSTRSRVLRSKLGNDGSQPSRAPRAFMSAMCMPLNAPCAQRRGQPVGEHVGIAPLPGQQREERRRRLVPRRSYPVGGERDRLEPGQRPHLLLPDVVRPASTVLALAPAQQHHRQECAVDLVGVEPVVGAGAHRDHRAALGQLGVPGELARGAHAVAAIDRGDQLLPGRRPDLIRVVISRRPLSR